MDIGLAGKCALITGGARGIGFATARILAGEGVKIALVDINSDGIEHGAKMLRDEFGIDAISVTADISAPAAVAKMIETISQDLAPPDILVNSAAVLDNKTFLESDGSDWDRMLGVCLTGPMHLMHGLLPGMIERGFGRMIFLASDAARVGQARLSYYAAAKGGIVALVKSVAQEVGTHGITMNVVSPGATNTELRQDREAEIRQSMGEEKYASYTRKVNRRYPVGRIGEPDDIAGMISYLASDKAAWVTGQVISVNGGFVMP
ncbi:MAG: SDR family oxidoreductase [Pseudomonadota bacterium]